MDVGFFALSGGACIGCGPNGERRYLAPEAVARALVAAAVRPADPRKAARANRRKVA